MKNPQNIPEEADSATLITASNGVVIKHGSTVITADSARINQEAGEAVADGNARLSNPQGVLTGERITFNYRTGQAKAVKYGSEKKGNPPPVSAKQPPPQISIKVSFVELKQDDNRVNGFDWYLKNFLLANGATTNSFWKKMWSFTGILTDSQFRVVLRKLEQQAGAEILTAPQLTTPSGRQAQIQITEPQTAGPGANRKVPAPIRLALDLIPSVTADGNTIQMTLIPRIGHDESGKDAPIDNSLSPPGTNSPLPLPRTRLVQVTSSAVVRDGQTMVLDLTSELESKDKPRRLIFVTPRLIDAAGNPLHSDAELQSGENTLLPQPVDNPTLVPAKAGSSVVIPASGGSSGLPERNGNVPAGGRVQPQILIEAKFIELADFDPVTEPADLKPIPLKSEMLTRNS